MHVDFIAARPSQCIAQLLLPAGIMASALYPSQSITNFAVLITGDNPVAQHVSAGAAGLLACNCKDLTATLLVSCVTSG